MEIGVLKRAKRFMLHKKTGKKRKKKCQVAKKKENRLSDGTMPKQILIHFDKINIRVWGGRGVSNWKGLSFNEQCEMQKRRL